MKKKLPPCFAFKNSGKHPRKDEIKKRFNEIGGIFQDFQFSGVYYGRRKDSRFDWFNRIETFGSTVVEITEDDFLDMTEPELTKLPDNNDAPDFPYKGDIKDFPKEVVEWMMDNQVKQGNKRDVSVFERCKSRCKSLGGFEWVSTIEGQEFCEDVILDMEFNLFFERYPKKTSPEKTITGQIIKISERGILIKLTKEQIKEMAGRIFEVVTIK